MTNGIHINKYFENIDWMRNSLEDEIIHKGYDPIDQVARSPIETLKGTTGRYGITDYLKFTIGMFFKRCFRLRTLDDRRQKKFYDHFNALKNALHEKDPQKKIRSIQKNYDYLFAHARAVGNNKNPEYYTDAVSTILKEELSEQTTQNFLHEILLAKGANLVIDIMKNISLQNFTCMFDLAAKSMVDLHYGTEEVAKRTFIEAAVRAVNEGSHDNALEDFLKTTEGNIKNLAKQDFASAAEVAPFLKDFAEKINVLLQGTTDITKEVLDKIEYRGVCLMRNIANPQEFIEKLEKTRQNLFQMRQEAQELEARSAKIRQQLHRQHGVLDEQKEGYIGMFFMGLKWDEKKIKNSESCKRELEQKEKEYQAKKAEVLNLGLDTHFKAGESLKDEKNSPRRTYDHNLAQLELKLIESEMIKRREEATLAALRDRIGPLLGIADEDREITLSDKELLLLTKVFPELKDEYYIHENLERAQKAAAEAIRMKTELDQIQTGLQKNAVGTAKLLVVDLPQEMGESVAAEINEKVKAREKEKILRSLEIAYQISEVSAVANLSEWERTFNDLNPSLRKAYGRIEVGFNRDQLRMVKCQELVRALKTL